MIRKTKSHDLLPNHRWLGWFGITRKNQITLFNTKSLSINCQITVIRQLIAPPQEKPNHTFKTPNHTPKKTKSLSGVWFGSKKEWFGIYFGNAKSLFLIAKSPKSPVIRRLIPCQSRLPRRSQDQRVTKNIKESLRKKWNWKCQITQMPNHTVTKNQITDHWCDVWFGNKLKSPESR